MLQLLPTLPLWSRFTIYASHLKPQSVPETRERYETLSLFSDDHATNVSTERQIKQLKHLVSTAAKQI